MSSPAAEREKYLERLKKWVATSKVIGKEKGLSLVDTYWNTFCATKSAKDAFSASQEKIKEAAFSGIMATWTKWQQQVDSPDYKEIWHRNVWLPPCRCLLQAHFGLGAGWFTILMGDTLGSC